MRGVHLPFPPQQDLVDALDEVRCAASELRHAKLQQPAVVLLADNFSGKSSQLRKY